MSLAKKQKKGVQIKKNEYIPLVGDPCYLFNRLTKERFLKDLSCAFLFLLASDYIKSQLPMGKNFNSNLSY